MLLPVPIQCDFIESLLRVGMRIDKDFRDTYIHIHGTHSLIKLAFIQCN